MIKYYYSVQNKRDVVQPGRALAWGARSRWFESSHPDQTKEILPKWRDFFCLERSEGFEPAK